MRSSSRSRQPMSPSSTRRAHEASRRGRGAVAVLLARRRVAASAEQRNPFESDEAAIRIGTSLFAARCAALPRTRREGPARPRSHAALGARRDATRARSTSSATACPAAACRRTLRPITSSGPSSRIYAASASMPPLVTSGRRARAAASLFAERVRRAVIKSRQRWGARAGSHGHRRRALARRVDGRAARTERHRRARLPTAYGRDACAASESRASSRARTRSRCRSSPLDGELRAFREARARRAHTQHGVVDAGIRREQA